MCCDMLYLKGNQLGLQIDSLKGAYKMKVYWFYTATDSNGSYGNIRAFKGRTFHGALVNAQEHWQVVDDDYYGKESVEVYNEKMRRIRKIDKQRAAQRAQRKRHKRV